MSNTQYQVKAGDTLYAVSRRYDVEIEELCKLNRIQDANLIFVGQMLKIPSGQSARRFSIQKTSSSLPNARANQSGEVLLGFHGRFPSERELATRLAGFRRWAIFTLEQPVTELSRHSRHGSMPFVFDHRQPLAGQDWFPPRRSPPAQSPTSSSPYAHARDGAATGALLRATWPYYYRFLASYDPALAQIMAGQPLVPRAPSGGPTAFRPAATQVEMTFRHTRPGGNVLQIGTDRISTGNKLVRILEAAQGRGTGQIVRVDPAVVGRNGQTFLSARDVLSDLNDFERLTQRELKEALKTGRGGNHLDRLRNRLNGIKQARQYARSYGEGHGVSSLPSQAMNGVHSARSELVAMRATQGLRVAGGILVVYGAYESVDRIAKASTAERPRVATQEVGGWAGGFAGAWAVGQLFAAGGAALGIETGPGAVVTGIIGGIAGGIVGGIGGALGADWVYARIRAQ